MYAQNTFSSSVSYLDGEFDVVTEVRSNAVTAVHLGHVEEDFPYHVSALNEAKIILQAVDHALNHKKDFDYKWLQRQVIFLYLVFYRGSRVLETDGASNECARALHCGHLEAHLKGDLVLQPSIRSFDYNYKVGTKT